METKSYRGGAPRKADTEKRERRVEIRFTPDEYTRLSERKSKTKAIDLTAFIRDVCLDKPLRMKPQLTTHEEQVLSLVREMRSDMLRIGVNINQASKRINSTTDYHDLQREVNQMSSQLGQMDVQLRALMSAALGTYQPANLTASTNDGSPDQ